MHTHISINIHNCICVASKAYFTFQIMRCGHIKCHAYFMLCIVLFSLFFPHCNTRPLLVFFCCHLSLFLYRFWKFQRTKGTNLIPKVLQKYAQNRNKEHYMQFANEHSSGPDVKRHLGRLFVCVCHTQLTHI